MLSTKMKAPRGFGAEPPNHNARRWAGEIAAGKQNTVPIAR